MLVVVISSVWAVLRSREVMACLAMSVAARLAATSRSCGEAEGSSAMANSLRMVSVTALMLLLRSACWWFGWRLVVA